MHYNDKILICGNGMVGSSIFRKLQELGYKNILTMTHKDIDFTNQTQTKSFFKDSKIDYIFLASAKVGGIYSNNTYPVDFLYDNMMIEFNVIKYAAENNVKKLMMFGSSCIYPKECSQPLKEEYLLSNYLEKTNEGYALAKISGIKLCEAYNKQYGTNFINVMPCSLYGINDTFDLKKSHLIPALIMKMHNAKVNNIKEIELWGNGTPRREFLYIDDLAEACIFLMNNYNSSELINIGVGEDLSINEVAIIISEIVGFEGEFKYDINKPNGTMQKVLDCTKIHNLGWKHKIELKEGLKRVYQWYLQFKI
jgi:GDP-L-fucose synthase